MSHDIRLTRIRAEYLEMPGLRLTLEQAQRLSGVERAACQRVLDRVVETNVSWVRPNGTYARVIEGPSIHVRIRRT